MIYLALTDKLSYLLCIEREQMQPEAIIKEIFPIPV